MAGTDPFADLNKSATPSSSDPFADLSQGFDSATGAPKVAAAPEPKVSFGQKVKAIAKEAPGTALQMGAFAGASALPPGVGPAILTMGTAMKAVNEQGALSSLEDTKSSIPDINVPALTQRYYDSLKPGLLAKGWTDEHIMQEARDRATNAAYGAQATKDSIDQQVQQTRHDITALPGEAISNALFMGATPKVLGALGSGILKVTGQEALAASVKPATTALGKLGMSVLKHATSGGTIGALGVGGGRATDKALEAWAADKPAHEIAQELVKGGAEGGVEGLAIGAGLGGTIGPALEGGVHIAGKIAAAPAERAAAIARDLADKSAAQVAERDALISKTASAFDPHRVGVPIGTDPVQAAINVVEEAHGPDAINSAAGRDAIEQISNRIKLYQDANEALQGNIEPQHMGPSQGVLSGVLPVGAPTQAEGGLAPDTQLPPAVQGPIAAGRAALPTSYPTDFQPQNPSAPMEGLAGPIPTATEAPSAGTLPGPRPQPMEPAARLPFAPAPGAVPAPAGPGALRMPVETKWSQPELAKRAVQDLMDKGENAKALKLAEKHGLIKVPEKIKTVKPSAETKAAPAAEAPSTAVVKRPPTPTSAVTEFAQALHEYTSVPNFNDVKNPEMIANRQHVVDALHNVKAHLPTMTDKELMTLHQGLSDLANQTKPTYGQHFGLDRATRKSVQYWSGTFGDLINNELERRGMAPSAKIAPGTNPALEGLDKANTPEKLASPARDFGKLGVVTGESHANAQENAFSKFGQETPAEQGTRGYLTTSGRFVSAAEGDKIAEQAGQINEGATKSQQGTYSSQDMNFPKPEVKVETAPQEPTSMLAREKSTPAPQEVAPVSRPADAAAAALADETHGAVAASADGQTLNMQIGVKPGEVAKAGGPQKAIDRIVKAADEHGVSIETNLVPTAGPKGGKIPLEKLIPWYEARGFKVTETTKIPEGNLATAKLVREPIGQHQNDVASAMEKASADAQQRINSKTGGLHTGFDPSLIGDYSLQLAADMFSKRLRGRDEIASWAAEKWGAEVKPFIDEMIGKAQKAFVRMFKDTTNADQSLNDLMKLHESGKYGMGWYENTSNWAKQKFGKDSDMFLRFLAITSANGQTESGAAMALKAFSQWKIGMDFEGFRGDSMVGQLKKAAAGEALTENSKIGNFLEALRGNPDAVVLDRWMLDALNMKEKGGALKPNQYKIYEQVVRQLARDNEMTPRQFQAAVWEGARVRSIQTKEATGGRVLATKVGSARPLEDLVDRKLGGLTPEQYAQDTKGHLEMMDNLYKALAPVRKGIEPSEGGFTASPDAPSGHTFNPSNFKPAAHSGHVVSLVSNVTDRASLYPARLLRFRDDVAPLLKELEAQGKKPTIGVWQEQVDGKPTGKFSIDLNVMIKDQKQALELGKLARNHEIAQLGKGGEWQQNIATGYDPAINGKQFSPPKDFRSREAWFKQQMNRARVFLKKTEPVGNPLANEKGKIEIGAPAVKTEKILSAMTDAGGKIIGERDLNTQKTSSALGMDSIWLSPDGDLVRLPMTHTRHAKIVTKALKIPAVKGYEGAAHGAGSEVQALLNQGFVRAQASGSMIAFDLSQPITDAQRSVMRKSLGAHEDWAAAISDSKGKLVKGMSSQMGDKAHHFLAAATEHNGK